MAMAVYWHVSARERGLLRPRGSLLCDLRTHRNLPAFIKVVVAAIMQPSVILDVGRDALGHCRNVASAIHPGSEHRRQNGVRSLLCLTRIMLSIGAGLATRLRRFEPLINRRPRLCRGIPTAGTIERYPRPPPIARSRSGS